MKGNRTRSPLDLKFMQVKFLKLDEEWPQRNHAKQSPRKKMPAHGYSYSQSFETTVNNVQGQNLEEEIDSLTQVISLQQERLRQSETNRKELHPQRNHSQSVEQENQHSKELLLRSKISALRSNTDAIHKQILDLYQGDLTAEQDCVKRISKVRRLPAKDNNNAYSAKLPEPDVTSFYENLRRSSLGDREYLRRIAELKEKLQASTVPKKFQEYLLSENLRVPMFLKELLYTPAKN